MAALRQDNLDIVGQVSTLLRQSAAYKAASDVWTHRPARHFALVWWNDGLNIQRLNNARVFLRSIDFIVRWHNATIRRLVVNGRGIRKWSVGAVRWAFG